MSDDIVITLTARMTEFDEIQEILEEEMWHKNWVRKFVMLIRWRSWRNAYQEKYKVFVSTKQDNKSVRWSMMTGGERQGVFLLALSDREDLTAEKVFLDKKGYVLSPPTDFAGDCHLAGVYRETQEHIFLFLLPKE